MRLAPFFPQATFRPFDPENRFLLHEVMTHSVQTSPFLCEVFLPFSRNFLCTRQKIMAISALHQFHWVDLSGQIS